MSVRACIALLFVVAPVAAARERAILIYPRERAFFRRVFYTPHQAALRRRLARTYDVEVYKQVATADELFAIDVAGAKLLVISGHGDAFSISMNGRAARTLDSKDSDRLTAFFSRLDPGATIVLQSCETGRGFAHLVKDAAGPTRRVIAANGEIPWNGMRITSIEPFDVTIRCRDGARRWDCTLRLW
jgi:hypothetical protein